MFLLVILDSIYTLIYSNSHFRNKIQFVLNSSAKHYDVIILGSSRAENNLMPEIFRKEGLHVYNYGITGAYLCENALMLKLFFEKGNTTDKILFQVDSFYNYEQPSSVVQVSFIPYLPINKYIYNHYKDNTEDSFILAFFPFYRYCILDSKIGFREMFLTLINKKSNSFSQDGFIPLEGTLLNNLKFELPEKIRNKNKYYLEIDSICKKNKVKLISFIAPSCSNTNKTFFLKLKHEVSELYDYSNFIKEDSLFANCGHLNKKGAEVFTNKLLERHFGNDLKKARK